MALQILIIDDDEAQLDRLAFLLEKAGFGVESAGCVVAGLESAKTLNPDLIISRETLPDLALTDLLEIKNEEPSLVDIPVVALIDEAAERIEYYRAGCQDVISIPFDEAELLFRIRIAMRRSGPKGVSGSFSHINLIDLIQMLISSRRDGKLDIDCGESSGTLFFKEGQVVHAVADGLSGEEAFIKLLRESQSAGGSGGEFNFNSEKLPEKTPESITQRTDHLLLSLANVLDES